MPELNIPHIPDFPNLPTDWRAVQFADVATAELAPGAVVVRLGALRDYNMVEERICAILKRGEPMIWSQGDPLRYEPAIASYRLADKLRPDRSFRGRVVDGQAVFLPFRTARLVAHDGKMRPHVASGRISDATPGLGVIFLGEYHSARGKLGHLMMEATYNLREKGRHPTRDSDDEYRKNMGFVRRTFGPRTNVRLSGDILAELRDTSIDSARRAARYALIHTFRGGLPQ